MKMTKHIYGFVGLIALAIGTILAMTIAFSNAKVGNYQQNAISCLTSEDYTSTECKRMTLFGVDPTSYITDDKYRKKIDAIYMDAVIANAKIAPKVAEFTLDYGVKNNVKFVAEIYKKLHEKSPKSNDK